MILKNSDDDDRGLGFSAVYEVSFTSVCFLSPSIIEVKLETDG